MKNDDQDLALDKNLSLDEKILEVINRVAETKNPNLNDIKLLIQYNDAQEKILKNQDNIKNKNENQRIIYASERFEMDRFYAESLNKDEDNRILYDFERLEMNRFHAESLERIPFMLNISYLLNKNSNYLKSRDNKHNHTDIYYFDLKQNGKEIAEDFLNSFGAKIRTDFKDKAPEINSLIYNINNYIGSKHQSNSDLFEQLININQKIKLIQSFYEKISYSYIFMNERKKIDLKHDDTKIISSFKKNISSFKDSTIGIFKKLTTSKDSLIKKANSLNADLEAIYERFIYLSYINDKMEPLFEIYEHAKQNNLSHLLKDIPLKKLNLNDMEEFERYKDSIKSIVSIDESFIAFGQEPYNKNKEQDFSEKSIQNITNELSASLLNIMNMDTEDLTNEQKSKDHNREKQNKISHQDRLLETRNKSNSKGREL
ncbi:MAG: hypothetical protein U1E31_00840 [Rickettsiales bacterium]